MEAMQCPKCLSVMPAIDIEGIKVNRCGDCSGLWFDRLEHVRLKAIEGSESIDIGAVKVGKRYNALDTVDCPVCKTRMTSMVDPSQPHIRYESCANCHGVFFDAGEFADYKEKTVLDFVRDLFAKELR